MSSSTCIRVMKPKDLGRQAASHEDGHAKRQACNADERIRGEENNLDEDLGREGRSLRRFGGKRELAM